MRIFEYPVSCHSWKIIPSTVSTTTTILVHYHSHKLSEANSSKVSNSTFFPLCCNMCHFLPHRIFSSKNWAFFLCIYNKSIQIWVSIFRKRNFFLPSFDEIIHYSIMPTYVTYLFFICLRKRIWTWDIEQADNKNSPAVLT